MPQESFEDYVAKIVSKYQYADKTRRDIISAIGRYRNLFLKFDTHVFNDGTRQGMVCLDGTIPVTYKGTIYNFPVCIWLLDTHPYNSPICYVKPTPDMQIKASRYVDTNGRIYLPYLHHWNPTSSDLLGLIQVMIIVFGETPPLYSKPKTQQTQDSASHNPPPPYPAQASSFMPMPNVGTPYPSYPPVSGSTPYPPVPSGYPPYSGPYIPPTRFSYNSYNSATGMSTPSSYTPASTAGYPPAPPPTTATPATQATPSPMGTISEEHIHASLLSAVEDKLKKRLREVLAQSQAEIEVLKKTQDDLTKGKAKLEDMLRRMQNEQVDLEQNIHVLREKDEEMNELLTKMENQEELDIDDAVITTAPLYKQLLNTFAEENATEDAIYYLGEALRKGVIDLDLFLKHVRQMSRKQFMLRALMQKCRQKANLPH